jgi:hypothetical protein
LNDINQHKKSLPQDQTTHVQGDYSPQKTINTTKTNKKYRNTKEHDGGARLREGLMGAHRLGLERTRSMNLYRFEKWSVMGSEKGAVDGTTVVDSGPRVEISR